MRTLLNTALPLMILEMPGCVPRSPEAGASVSMNEEAPLEKPAPLTITWDTDQVVDPNAVSLANRVRTVGQWVMDHGSRTLSTPPYPLGKEATCQRGGRVLTASVFDHDNVRSADIFSLREGGRRACTDVGLNGRVDDCAVYGEQDSRLLIDPDWKRNFIFNGPSIGVGGLDLQVTGEAFRLDHQLWFEDNVAVMEACAVE